MLSLSPFCVCSLNQLNVIHLCFLSARWERSTFLNFRRRWQESSPFFLDLNAFMWQCVQSGQWNIKCPPGFCLAAQWKRLYHVPPSIKHHSLAEADTAVVSHWYLCCSSLLNYSSLQSQPSAAVSSLHLSDCHEDSCLIRSLTAAGRVESGPVDIWLSTQLINLEMSANEQIYCNWNSEGREFEVWRLLSIGCCETHSIFKLNTLILWLF